MHVIVKEAKKKTGYVGTNALNKNHVCQLPTKVKGARNPSIRLDNAVTKFNVIHSGVKDRIDVCFTD